jgi:integral membrane sensor domain MASE1
MPVPAWASRSARRWLRDVVAVAALVAAYTAGTTVAYLLFQVSEIGPAFFPSAGVTLAALVLARRSLWPALLVAAAVTEIVVDRSQGYDWAVSVGFALANTVEPLVGAGLLLGRDLRLDLSRAAHVVRFLLLGVLGGPLVGAAIGATVIRLDVGRSWTDAFGPWWSGDALGVLVVGGVLLGWARGGWADRPLRHVATLAIGGGVVAWSVAIGFWSDNWLAYLVLPILVLAAAWLGVRGVALAGATTAGVAMVMTALDRGPWANLWALSAHGRLVQLQWFLLLMLATVWFLAGAVTGWRREERESRRATEAWARSEHLNRLAAQLAAALTPRDIARAAVESGTSLVAPRGAVAWIAGGGTGVRLLSSRHLAGGRTLTGPERVPMDAPLPMTEAIRTGRRVALDSPEEMQLRYPGSAEEYRQSGTCSSLHVPLRSGQQTVGVLSVEFDEPGPVHRSVSTLVQTVADMVAQGLERARLYEEEREAGLTLQRALLPRQLPRLPGVRAAGRGTATWRSAATGTTWSRCRTGGSGSWSATWSGTGCRRPP